MLIAAVLATHAVLHSSSAVSGPRAKFERGYSRAQLPSMPAEPVKFFNMSNAVGAMYTPWKSANQFWWHKYADYRADVVAEVKSMRQVIIGVDANLNMGTNASAAIGLRPNICASMPVLEAHAANRREKLEEYRNCVIRQSSSGSRVAIENKGWDSISPAGIL